MINTNLFIFMLLPLFIKLKWCIAMEMTIVVLLPKALIFQHNGE